MFRSPKKSSRRFVVVLLLFSLNLCVSFAIHAQYEPVLTIRIEKPEMIFAVTFSPDGKRLLTGGNNDAVLWDAETGARLRTFGGLNLAVSVAFSPDGKLALSGAYDYVAKLWEVETGKELHTFRSPTDPTRKGIPLGYMCGAFSPDGKTILTGDSYQVVQLWDIETGQQIWRPMWWRYHVTAVAFLPSGKKVLLQSGRIGLVSIERDELVYLLDARSFSLSRDGKRMLTNDGYLRDVETGEVIRAYEPRRPAESVALSPDGKLAVIGGSTGWRENYPRTIFDTDTAERLRVYSFATNPDVKDSPTSPDYIVLFAPDGKRFLSVNGEWDDDRQAIHIWDISDLATAVREAPLHNR